MVYDDLYIALRDRLLDPTKPDLGIRTIDWANEQAERMEAGDQVEGLVLPAVLVRYEEPEWKARGRKHSEAEGVIYLDVLRELSDHPLASDRAPATVAATRATYDAVKEIAKRVVGMRGEGYGTVGLVGLQPDHSYRRLRVDTIALRSLLCMDLDTETYTLVERPDLGIGTNPPMAVPSLLQHHIDTNTPAAVVAAVNNSPIGPDIIEELCDCEDGGTPVPVPVVNSAGASQGNAVAPGPFVAADGTVTARNSALTPLGSANAPSGGSAFLPIADVQHTQSDGSPAILPAGVPLVCTPPAAEVLELYMDFRAGDALSAEVTVPATYAGAYTIEANDGGSGTVTWQRKVASVWGNITLPYTLATNDVIRAQRTVTTNTGWATTRTA